MPPLPIQFTFSAAATVLARFALGPGDYVIGRDESCQVVIDLEGMLPRHACLHVAETVLLEDLGTETGTFLEGRRIVEPAPLAIGQPVTFGTCAGELQIDNTLGARLAARRQRQRPKKLRNCRKPPAARLSQASTEAAPPALAELPPPPAPGEPPSWEVWPAEPKAPVVVYSPEAEAGAVQLSREQLAAGEPVPDEELRRLSQAQERELRELHAQVTRLEEEARQRSETDRKTAAEEEHARANTGLLTIANRALLRHLSKAAGATDELANLRKELRQREKALVEAWSRRQASDERCNQLTRQVTRLEQGLAEPLPAPTVLFPVWLVWSSAALMLGFGVLGWLLHATQERAKVAEAIVARVHRTAPQFFQEARALVTEREFKQALDKIECAIALERTRPEYFFERGNICESLLQLGPAIQSYEQGLELSPAAPEAQRNLELCREIQAGRHGVQAVESQYALHRLMLSEERLPEALSMAQRLGKDKALLQRTWLAIFDHAGLRARLSLNEDETFDLDLSGQSRVDLTLLRGLPLRRLALAHSSVADLTPLHGMAVRELDLSGNPLRDLIPLAGMPLEILNLSETQAANLLPLTGMPLRELRLNQTEVSDLSALRGMRLQTLQASGTTVWNLAPLAEAPLQALELAGTRVSDLSVLSRLPIQVLNVEGTGVVDLQPLAGAPLVRLNLTHTRVRSVEPLKGLPLRELLLGGCEELEGVAVLAECAELERLVLPPHCTQLSMLRGLPQLRFLAYETGNPREAREQTAQRFWEKYQEP